VDSVVYGCTDGSERGSAVPIHTDNSLEVLDLSVRIHTDNNSNPLRQRHLPKMSLRRILCGSSVYTHSKSVLDTLWPIADATCTKRLKMMQFFIVFHYYTKPKSKINSIIEYLRVPLKDAWARIEPHG